MLAWEDARSKLQAKPGAFLREGYRLFFKLAAYLDLLHEVDPAGKLARWKRTEYVSDPERSEEVIRRQGAILKKGSGAARGKAKGAKKAIFISARVLRSIHEARLSGAL